MNKKILKRYFINWQWFHKQPKNPLNISMKWVFSNSSGTSHQTKIEQSPGDARHWATPRELIPHVENGHKWTISIQHDAAMIKARECCENTEVQLHQLNQPTVSGGDPGSHLSSTLGNILQRPYESIIHNIWNKIHKHISLMIYLASNCEDYSDLRQGCCPW